MNTRRGKGYFYSMGARDGSKHPADFICVGIKRWPKWAQSAYLAGRTGVDPNYPPQLIMLNCRAVWGSPSSTYYYSPSTYFRDDGSVFQARR